MQPSLLALPVQAARQTTMPRPQRCATPLEMCHTLSDVPHSQRCAMSLEMCHTLRDVPRPQRCAMPLLVCSRSPCSLELSFSEPTLAGGKQSLQHVWQRFTKVPQIIFVLSFQNFILLYSYLLISLEPKHRTQFSTHGPVSIRFFACVTLANMEICHFALAKTFGYI